MRAASVHGAIAFCLGALAALLTSFYSWRLIFLTFFGKRALGGVASISSMRSTAIMTARRRAWRQRHAKATPPAGTGGYHPHESPLTMLVPIGLLALGAVFAGQLFHDVLPRPEVAPSSGTAASRSTRILPTPRTRCRAG